MSFAIAFGGTPPGGFPPWIVFGGTPPGGTPPWIISCGLAEFRLCIGSVSMVTDPCHFALHRHVAQAYFASPFFFAGRQRGLLRGMPPKKPPGVLSMLGVNQADWCDRITIRPQHPPQHAPFPHDAPFSQDAPGAGRLHRACAGAG